MGRFLEKLMAAPEVKPLLSDEHFSVDGTLLQAWASHASLERIDGEEDPPPPPSGPGEGFGAPKPGKKRAKGDFRGIKLSNKTHRSSVDSNALLCRKSKAHPDQGLCRSDAPLHRRDAARGAEHRPLWWFRHRWAHHPPRGLRQVDPYPPRHREGVWLDQTVGRSASVPTEAAGRACRRH
jgi:hypothetical protein